MFELGTTKLIFPNEGLNDNMKIDKTLEESSLLIKGISETGTKYIKRHNESM